jgi:toxin CptA
MLCLLGMLAPFSAIASDLPRLVAWPLAVLIAGFGLRQARDEHRKTPLDLLIGADAAGVTIDNVAVEDFTIEWRGPLAFARWRNEQGHVQRVMWWPDTLPNEARRELRLATPARSPARAARSVAT